MTRLQFLGIATLLVETGNGRRVLIDPFLDGNPASPLRAADLERVDLLLITHASFDHFGQAPEIARRFGCPVVCGPEVKLLLVEHGVSPQQLITVTWGLRAEVLGIGVQVVESHHWSFGTTRAGNLVSGPALGFVLALEPDLRFYVTGDSALFEGLKQIGRLYKPNIGLVPVAIPDLPGVQPATGRLSRGMMSPCEAVLAAQWLGLECAIPCHFVDVDGDEVAEFLGALDRQNRSRSRKVQPLVLRPGEVYDFVAKSAGRTDP